MEPRFNAQSRAAIQLNNKDRRKFAFVFIFVFSAENNYFHGFGHFCLRLKLHQFSASEVFPAPLKSLTFWRYINQIIIIIIMLYSSRQKVKILRFELTSVSLSPSL